MSPGPRGAQYEPVWSMPKVSMKVIIDLAASSGVTAAYVLLILASIQIVRCRYTSTRVPELVEANALRHLGSHETWMEHAHCDAFGFQIEA